MTLGEIIADINGLKPSQFSSERLAKWIWELDAKIYLEILKDYEGEFSMPEEYSVNDLSKVLIVPKPYTDVYLWWLSAKIDAWNRDNNYNRSVIVFTDEYNAYAAYINNQYTHKNSEAII